MKVNRTVSSPAFMEIIVWQRREILKTELQNLLLTYYCGKCCTSLVLGVHQAKGQDGDGEREWEVGERQPDLAKRNNRFPLTYFISQWSFLNLLMEI